MNSKILQGFIEEAESCFSNVRASILLCSQNGKSTSELEDSVKGIANIKSASSAIGLEKISQTARELEQNLKHLIETDSKLADSQTNAVLDKLAGLEAEVSRHRFDLDELAFDASDLVEECFDNFQSSGQFKEEPIEKPAEIEADDFEEFEIDDEMLEIFAMEAEDHLQNINENLKSLEKDTNNREALLEIRRSSHTLKGSAGIVGLKTLSTLAHKVEDLLDYISDNEIESNVEIFQLLLSATDCISAIINKENSSDLNDKIIRTQQKFEELLITLQQDGSNEVINQAPVEIESKELPEAKIPVNLYQPNPPVPATTTQSARPVIRVSLDKLDDLVKLIGEMVFSHSVFEQRLSEFEQQINELQNSTRRLRLSTGKLETGFDSGIPGNISFNSPQAVSLTTASEILGRSNPWEIDENSEFDSLEFDRYTDFNQTTRELIETTNDTLSINTELETIHNFLGILFESQKQLIDEMQDKLLSLRMVSFATLSARLQRTVRVTAEEEEKLVDLIIEGDQLEVDTQILDSLIDPLLHLLRNAVAHGIEPPATRRLIGKDERGKIILKVHSEGTHIVLSVTDDGRGISTNSLLERAVSIGKITSRESHSMTREETLDLVFQPGLTTADEISQVSGRGVGMNIVKTNIEKQKGSISTNSELQKGTTFTLRLPMALAVTRCLLIQANNQIFAFPLNLVKHISEISPTDLAKLKKDNQLVLGNKKHQVSHLNELLGLPIQPKPANQDIPLLVLETVSKPYALLVDKIIKPQEVVIKPLGDPLKNVQSLLGATLMGDGSVIPVLDLIYLLDGQNSKLQTDGVSTQSNEAEKISVMIVDDSPSVRHVNSKLVKNNNWEPIIAKDGLEALEILSTSNSLPDVILTDVEMPDMDGYELLATLKQTEHLREIPVVMITSRTTDKHRQKAHDLGVSDYVTKPYDDSLLVGIIKKLCS